MGWHSSCPPKTQELAGSWHTASAKYYQSRYLNSHHTTKQHQHMLTFPLASSPPQVTFPTFFSLRSQTDRVILSKTSLVLWQREKRSEAHIDLRFPLRNDICPFSHSLTKTSQVPKTGRDGVRGQKPLQGNAWRRESPRRIVNILRNDMAYQILEQWNRGLNQGILELLLTVIPSNQPASIRTKMQ